VSESKVMKDLKEGFAGESQANRKYLAFAEQAKKEGHPYVAKLFTAIAEAETLHAHYHLRTMGGIKSTAENLQTALDGETYEFTTMYPEFIEHAKEEGNSAAERSFHLANEAEKIHGDLFKKALENLGQKENPPVYLCPVCGHVAENSPPESCPICGAKAAAYKEYL